VTSADNFQVSEGVQRFELRILSLDVEIAGDLFDRGQHFQLDWIHGSVSRPEGEVFVEVLESGEAGVEDGDGPLDDGAVLEGVDVSGMKGVGKVANLRTGTVARNALAIFGLENK
jgi:hypothetical protein